MLRLIRVTSTKLQSLWSRVFRYWGQKVGVWLVILKILTSPYLRNRLSYGAEILYADAQHKSAP